MFGFGIKSKSCFLNYDVQYLRSNTVLTERNKIRRFLLSQHLKSHPNSNILIHDESVIQSLYEVKYKIKKSIFCVPDPSPIIDQNQLLMEKKVYEC